jgi:hypothetical protein
MSYDIIGDVHGHYDELIGLLIKLGYISENNLFIHPEGRKPVFVGDLIDRGPKIRETLHLVKNMVDNDLALCIMGNHEYNAVNFWDLRRDGGGYYREHTHANLIQHAKTIEAFKNRDKEWKEYCEWMRHLPVMLEFDNFRVVHAVYHPMMLKLYDNVKSEFKNDKDRNRILLEVAREKNNVKWSIDNIPVYKILEITMKGIQVKLQNGICFYDKEGVKRTKSRIKWWLNPIGNTYDIYLEPYAGKQPKLKNVPVDVDLVDPLFRQEYSPDEKPVFFGHYWLQMAQDTGPQVQSHNVCCLDYSVAKNGYLVCYRYDGETKLSNDKFMYIKNNKQ